MSPARPFHALDFPDTLAEKRLWIEDRIVASDFMDFVGQLDVVGAASKEFLQRINPNQSLQEILGSSNRAWLESGLQELTSDQVHALLLSPAALLELNDAVFRQGGHYWSRKIDASINTAFGSRPQTNVQTAKTRQSTSGFKLQDSLTTILAIAAGLLLVAALVLSLKSFVGPEQNQIAQGWGWDRDDWFEDAKDSDQYIDRLVAGALAWHNKPVNSFEEYRTRLKQLSAGCQKMIDGEHELLDVNQRLTLRNKCIAWQEKFLAQLENVTPENFQEMKKETDEIIKNAVKALNEIRQV